MKKREKQKPENPERLNRLVEGTKLRGDLETDSSLRIDGSIEGNIKCNGRFVLGRPGIVKGNIIANDVEIDGQVEGHIHSDELLTLHATAVITGDIQTKRIVIEDGAKVNGNILTGEKSKMSPKELFETSDSEKGGTQSPTSPDMIF